MATCVDNAFSYEWRGRRGGEGEVGRERWGGRGVEGKVGGGGLSILCSFGVDLNLIFLNRLYLMEVI